MKNINTYKTEKKKQLYAADLPLIKLCDHFILLLGFELVIMKQTQDSTFCCRLDITTSVHFHMVHFQVLK